MIVSVLVSIKTIRDCIFYRLKNSRWPKAISHTRQGHWLRSLYRKTPAYINKVQLDGQFEATRLFRTLFDIILIDYLVVPSNLKGGGSGKSRNDFIKSESYDLGLAK